EERRALPRAARFDPPYTSLQVTEIVGGTASNIVPVPCWFGWEIRRLPGFDGMELDQRFRRFAAEHCVAEMQRSAPETGIQIDIVNDVPAFEADPKSKIVPLALNPAGNNRPSAVSSPTAASLFQNGGAPAIVIGPGNIAQAHTPNEFLHVAELEKCLA